MIGRIMEGMDQVRLISLDKNGGSRAGVHDATVMRRSVEALRRTTSGLTHFGGLEGSPVPFGGLGVPGEFFLVQDRDAAEPNRIEFQSL